MKKRNYTDDAMNIPELSVKLQAISEDDKKEIESYTQQEVLNEAKYVLSCYFENGHCLNDDRIGDIDEEARRDARSQIGKLRRYIKRYS